MDMTDRHTDSDNNAGDAYYHSLCAEFRANKSKHVTREMANHCLQLNSFPVHWPTHFGTLPTEQGGVLWPAET